MSNNNTSRQHMGGEEMRSQTLLLKTLRMSAGAGLQIRARSVLRVHGSSTQRGLTNLRGGRRLRSNLGSRTCTRRELCSKSPEMAAAAGQVRKARTCVFSAIALPEGLLKGLHWLQLAGTLKAKASFTRSTPICRALDGSGQVSRSAMVVIGPAAFSNSVAKNLCARV